MKSFLSVLVLLVSVAVQAAPCTGVDLPGTWKVSGNGVMGEIEIDKNEFYTSDKLGTKRPFRSFYVNKGNQSLRDQLGRFDLMGLITVVREQLCVLEVYSQQTKESMMLVMESVNGYSALGGVFEEELMVFSQYKNPSTRYSFELIDR